MTVVQADPATPERRRGRGLVITGSILLALSVLIAIVGFGAVALFVPWVLAVIAVFAQPKLWQRQRARITAWLDRFPAAT